MIKFKLYSLGKSSPHFIRHMMLRSVVDVNFDPFVKVILSIFSTVKLLFFPFVINNFLQ